MVAKVKTHMLECLFQFSNNCLICNTLNTTFSDILMLLVILTVPVVISVGVSFASFRYFHKHNPLSLFMFSSKSEDQMRQNFLINLARNTLITVVSIVFALWAHVFFTKNEFTISKISNLALVIAMVIIVTFLVCFYVTYFLTIFSRSFIIFCILSPIPFVISIYFAKSDPLLITGLLFSIMLSFSSVLTYLAFDDNFYINIKKVSKIIFKNILYIFPVILIATLFSTFMVYTTSILYYYIQNKAIATLLYVFITVWITGVSSGIIDAFNSSFIFKKLTKTDKNSFRSVIKVAISLFGVLCYASLLPAIISTLLAGIELIESYLTRGSRDKKSSALYSLTFKQYIIFIIFDNIKTVLLALKNIVEFYNRLVISYIAIFGGDFSKEVFEKAKAKSSRSILYRSAMCFAIFKALLLIVSFFSLIGASSFGLNLFYTGYLSTFYVAFSGFLFNNANTVSIFIHYIPILFTAFFIIGNFIYSYLAALIAISYFDNKDDISSNNLKTLSINAESEIDLSLVDEFKTE